MGSKYKDPILAPVQLVTMDMYKRYRLEAGRRRVTDREDLSLIARKLLEELGKQIHESRGGVLIRGIGYFFVWKIPRKLYWPNGYTQKGVPFYGHVYSIKFIPAKRLRGWTFRKRFTKNVSHNVYKKLLKGYKYRVYLYTLRVMRLLN